MIMNNKDKELEKLIDKKIKEFLLKDLEISIRYAHRRNQILKEVVGKFKKKDKDNYGYKYGGSITTDPRDDSYDIE